MVKMMVNIGFYRKLLIFFLFFYHIYFCLGTFPHDDGTDSRRKGYTGGISIKKYMMTILVIFCKKNQIFFLIPGVRRAIFKIYPERKFRKMAGPAAGSRHRARQPGRTARGGSGSDRRAGSCACGLGRLSYAM